MIVSAWSILAFPSVTTVFLVVLWGARALAGAFSRDPHRRGRRCPTEHEVLFPVLAILGIALYATTIGSPSYNLYRLGFSPYAPLVLAILAALAARKRPVVAVIALAVLIAYDLHLYRSRNLLDYALDPILVAVAAGWCVRRIWRRVRELSVIGDRLSKPSSMTDNR